MNVLGKIKSKKPKPDANSKETQHVQIQDEKPKAMNSQAHLLQTLAPKQQIKSEQQLDLPKKIKSTKPVVEAEFITNTNIISKQKERAIRQQDSGLLRTTNSISNSFTSVFHTKKQSKKGVYFEDIPSVRTNSLASNQASRDKQKQPNHEESMMNDDEFSFDFDFLLSQRQKKEIKKSLHLSRGKAQNAKQIEQELKKENNEVLSFFIRKWNLYGDIYMFEGELESLKRKYIEIQSEQGKVKVYDRIKVKLSCAKEIIVAPQTIGRIFISDVIFLSEDQAMIPPEYLLKTVDKSRRRGRDN